jgi:hypothetical protein
MWTLGLHIVGRLAVHARGAGALVKPHPIPRHHKKRGIGNEVEQVIKPPVPIATGPQVQLGLDLQYPLLSRQQARPRQRLAGIHQRISWHSSLRTTNSLASFAMQTAFPPPDYYEASAPPETISRQTEINRLFTEHEATAGSPRITADLRDAGWRVSKNTVAKLMAGQRLAARRKRRRRCTTRPGKGRWRAPDLVKRDFSADRLNRKWFGDGTEIPTDEGKLYLDSVLDACSRRVLGFALGTATTRNWPTPRWPWPWRSAAAPCPG